MAKPYARKDSRFWWISPTINGVPIPQSTKTTDYQDALDMLRRLEGRIADGQLTPQMNRVLFSDLADDLLRDYRVKHRRSLPDLKRRLDKHILPLLGAFRASSITAGTVAEYIERRQAERDEEGHPCPAANASINRELAAIKRAYAIGRKTGKVISGPTIEMLPEDNERETAFSDAQFASIHKHANKTLKSVLTVAYWTGWRKTSIIRMQWPQVDFADGWIRLEAIRTKNRKATKFPLVPDLLALFTELRAETDKIQKERGIICPWVFHRNGQPVKSIRKAFEVARKKAGVPGHWMHDFRRTAVRALANLGYDYKTIMDCCGFKTVNMVIRYMGPTPDERIKELGERLQAKRMRTTF
jgi:integrase